MKQYAILADYDIDHGATVTIIAQADRPDILSETRSYEPFTAEQIARQNLKIEKIRSIVVTRLDNHSAVNAHICKVSLSR